MNILFLLYAVQQAQVSAFDQSSLDMLLQKRLTLKILGSHTSLE